MALLAGLVLLFGLGPFSLVSAHRQVTVSEGNSSVTLPFSSRPLGSSLSVLCTRESDEVHLNVFMEDDFRNQAPLFKNRTKMKFDAGNISLTLEHPTMTDAGVFTCVTREGGTVVARDTVELKVTARSPDSPPSSNVGLIVGLTVPSIFLIVLVILIVKTIERCKQTGESFKDAFIGIITCRKATSGLQGARCSPDVC